MSDLDQSSASPGQPTGAALLSVRRTTPAQVAWLDTELPQWVNDGLITAESAAQIRSRYESVQRFTLSRIVLTLGALFIGVGVIWLIAANRDELSPLIRFALVVALWLTLTAASLVVASRRVAVGDTASPLVGALRALAVVSYGGVIFQAAQSLQVVAYSPVLVGVWALGALLFAYATRALAPLAIGVTLAAFWMVQTVMDVNPSLTAFALAVGATGLAAAAIGVIHLARGWPDFAVPWRLVGAVLGLTGLFAGALPVDFGSALLKESVWWILGAASALVVVAAIALRRRSDRRELALAVGVMAATAGLSLWRPSAGVTDGAISSESYLRAVVAVVIYLIATSGYVVLGAARGLPAMTVIGTFALVIFITVQAFAVFSTIISGSALFLVVGVVLLTTGIAVDRGRRRLVAGIDEEQS